MTFVDRCVLRVELFRRYPSFSDRARLARALLYAAIFLAEEELERDLTLDEAVGICVDVSRWMADRGLDPLLENPTRHIRVFLSTEPWRRSLRS